MTNPYAPPRAFVRDIVGANAAVPADRSTRLGASILDGLIFGVMVYPPMFIAAAIGGLAGGSQETGNEGTILLLGVLLMFVGFVAWCWLTLRQMSRTSQSLAKKYLNIKVVRSDGSPISLGRLVWLRNVVNMLVGIVPLYALVDVLFIFGESRRCLHDMMADTMVVKV